ncbi:alpha/beta fold hydrolase [Paractinoplanes atraurantiacus]|uniref:Alpha/beta hydrolase fold n=1 Tax=Paractinoplanes atraurantiacus TaxID=1036182 RepID=A0A285J5U6_9ACTN|nr:alpha/beta fold hydrolase [Actinoplanes atraurantiacus]SNY54471.1 alpha/beta hydrolase fold [Actinoplanes atraurantiacus]
MADTVVFIAYLGGEGSVWQPVLDVLPDGIRAFTYDRPGLGDAPPRPAPNPPLSYHAFADELAAELPPGRVVLVGHSFGALIARAFASRYPERVAGFVCVDGSLPQLTLLPDGKPLDDGGTELDLITGQVEMLTAVIPDVPTVVLVRQRGWWSTGKPPHPAIDDLWHVSQRLLAEQWHAPVIVAERSGHMIPAHQPALVVYAIELVLSGRPVPDEARLAELGATRGPR